MPLAGNTAASGWRWYTRPPPSPTRPWCSILPVGGPGDTGARRARRIAKPLFEQYVIPFELTSVLLLAAIVGAVVLAKRRI
jgi:hypothetical protein